MFRLIPCTMGANASQLEKDIGSDLFPANEHYFSKPFREKVLEYKAKNKRTKETLLTCLADLFYSIVTQKRKVGTIAPKKFIARLRKEKVEFDNYMQQDAHEFLIFLINHINEIIVGEQGGGNGPGVGLSKAKTPDTDAENSITW